MKKTRRGRLRSGAKSGVVASSVKEVLGESFTSLNISAKVAEFRVRKMWPSLVGATIAEKAEPVRLIGSTLYVNVSSSAWMTELTYLKEDLLKKIDDSLGTENSAQPRPLIEDIIFRTGPVKGPGASTGTSTGNRPAQKRKVTPQECAFIEETSSGLRDPTLRALVSRTMKKGKALGPDHDPDQDQDKDKDPETGPNA